MVEQIHKRLIDEQVRMILDRYTQKELKADQAMRLLELKRRQFFEWVKRYREDPQSFSVGYNREEASRKIRPEIEKNMLGELQLEKGLITDPTLPIRFYNYSYIQDQLKKKYQEEVSLPTIIDRAKKTGFTCPSRKERCMIVRY
jgi:hypothetical protein